ncbi:MAG: hypothetical protein QOK06_1318, partial [Acidimicrobiaceae bacterium]
RSDDGAQIPAPEDDDFGGDTSRTGGWKRVVAAIVALSFLAPLAIGLVTLLLAVLRG